MSAREPSLPAADDLGILRAVCDDAGLLGRFNALVSERLAPAKCFHVACAVSHDYLFEFLLLYHSLAASWKSFPYLVHPFATDARTFEALEALGLPLARPWLLPPEDNVTWATHAASKIRIVTVGGLDEAVVSDLDNLFVGEVPELFGALEASDFVFVGSPCDRQILQTNLWGFRRTPAAVEFASDWHRESVPAHRTFSDAAGLPFALLRHQSHANLKVRALVVPRADGRRFHPCPYDVQANIRPLTLVQDEMGFYEPQMGRAKVIHFGGIRAEGSQSAAARMRVLAKRFPECQAVFPLYLRLANAAAGTLGRPQIRWSRLFLLYLAAFGAFYHRVHARMPRRAREMRNVIHRAEAAADGNR